SSATRTRRKCPIRQVDEFAIGMDMDWPGALLSRWLWIRQSPSDEKRLAREPYGGVEGIDVELVLPLDWNKGPRFGRMEIEVPRAEAETAARRDRGQIPQHAIGKGEGFDRARVLRLGGGGVIAARHQEDAAIVRRCQNLVRINAGVEISRLGDR